MKLSQCCALSQRFCYHRIVVLLRPSVVWWLEVVALTLCLIYQRLVLQQQMLTFMIFMLLAEVLQLDETA